MLGKGLVGRQVSQFGVVCVCHRHKGVFLLSLVDIWYQDLPNETLHYTTPSTLVIKQLTSHSLETTFREQNSLTLRAGWKNVLSFY